MSHDENERTFRATNIRRQRLRGSTPESFTGNLTEAERRSRTAGRYLVTLATPWRLPRRGDGPWSTGSRGAGDSPRVWWSRRCSPIRRGAERGGDPRGGERSAEPRGPEGTAPRPHGARNEQLADLRSGTRTAQGAGRRSRGSRRARRDTASGGPRPDRRFEPDGKKRNGSDGITTAPTTREHVREGTASLRSIAEAHQSIRQKRGAA